MTTNPDPSPTAADDPDDPPSAETEHDRTGDDAAAACGGLLVSLERADRCPVVDHELTIAPGAGPHDVAAHLLRVPAGASFVDMYGDVELTVVFREADRAA